jgi:hypothetical protein
MQSVSPGVYEAIADRAAKAGADRRSEAVIEASEHAVIRPLPEDVSRSL